MLREKVMLNEPRIYRHSPFRIGLVILIFGILGAGLPASIGWDEFRVLIPFTILFGIVFLTVLYSMTTKTIISDNEISTQTILGIKSLAWKEIQRVSGKGNAIKLYNSDGDVMVAPNQQLPGYEEIIEWIGAKRPDLFNPLEYSELSRSWLNTIIFSMFGILFVGFGYFIYTQTDIFFPMLMLLIFGVVFIGMLFATPQSVSIQNNSIVISYLLNQKTVPADEIRSVSLRYTQTRNGRNYFVALTLITNKVIRVAGLSPNLPVVYLVLKNWHKKYRADGQTNQQN